MQPRGPADNEPCPCGSGKKYKKCCGKLDMKQPVKQPVKPAPKPSTNRYEKPRLFISYKTEDANIARGLAERFISSGYDTWFAEYRIMLSEYFAEEEETERAIKDGVRAATHAILLTNDNWAESDWCGIEMAAITEFIGAGDRLIEVCIPTEEKPHNVYRVLRGGTPVVFRGNLRDPSVLELDELARQVARRLGIALNIDARRLPPESNPVVLSHYGITFDAGPLRRVHIDVRKSVGDVPLNEVAKRSEWLRNMLRFEGKIGGCDVVMHLFVYPQNAAIGRISIAQDGSSNDRAVCDDYRRYGQMFYSEGGYRTGSAELAREGATIAEGGLHVVFIGGHSHVGLTLKYSEGTLTMWERRYVVSLAHMRDDDREAFSDTGEAILCFTAKPEGSEREQYERFCRLTPAFDAIAQTFRERPATRSEALSNTLPIVAAGSGFSVAAWYLVSYLLGIGKPAWQVGGVSLLAGLLTADTLQTLLRPAYRRVLWTAVQLGRESTRGGFWPNLAVGVGFWFPVYVPAVLIAPFRRFFPNPLGTAISASTLFVIAVFAFLAQGIIAGVLSISPLMVVLVGATAGALLKVLEIPVERSYEAKWKQFKKEAEKLDAGYY